MDSAVISADPFRILAVIGVGIAVGWLAGVVVYLVATRNRRP